MKILKYLFLLLIAAAMIFLTACASEKYFEGEGTAENPYIIYGAEGLKYLSDNIKKYKNSDFTIKSDAALDLSVYENWTPIGSAADPYNGNFNGNRTIIKGLNIGLPDNVKNITAAGLFGYIGNNGYVENILVSQAEIYVKSNNKNSYAGIIAGVNNGVINYCDAEAGCVINGAARYTGGIVGGNINGTVINCNNKAQVIGNTAGGVAGVGDIIGVNPEKSLIVNCGNAGDVYGVKNAGGIAGMINENSELTVCYNTGTVSGEIAGNAVGVNNGGNIKKFSCVKNHLPVSGEGVSPKSLTFPPDDFIKNMTYDMNEYIDSYNKNAAKNNLPYGFSWIEGEKYPVMVNVLPSFKITSRILPETSVTKTEIYIYDKEIKSYNITDKTNFETGSKIKIIYYINETYFSLNSIDINMNGGKLMTSNISEIEYTVPYGNTDIIVSCDVIRKKKIELYVDYGNGNDDGNGTINDPFKTFVRVNEEITSLVNAVPSDITVYFREGKHRISDIIVIDGSIMKLSASSVTYTAYQNEKPIITDLLQLDSSKFKKVGGKEYYIYEFETVDNTYPEFRDLWVNGKRMQIARSHSTDEKYYFTTYYESMDGESPNYRNEIYVESEFFGDITTDNVFPLEICTQNQWMLHRLRVASVEGMDLTTGMTKITLNESDFYEKSLMNNGKRTWIDQPYWFENHIALLDEPGEFFYNRSTGQLYYYPYLNEAIADSVIEYSSLGYLIKLEGTSELPVYNITFNNLTFKGTTYNMLSYGYVADQASSPWYPKESAIYGNYTENITVERCKFTDLGSSGVYFYTRCNNTKIIGCSFTNLALYGIGAGYLGDRVEDALSENLFIANNYIENIGTGSHNCAAVQVGTGTVGLRILYNRIYFVPYSGICVGWHSAEAETHIITTDAEIAYNRIEYYASELYDAGGIYTLGDNSASLRPGEEYAIITHDNFIRASLGGGFSVGLYHDNNSTKIYSYDNVVDAHGHNYYLQTGVKDILLKNNYSVQSEIDTAGWETWGERKKNNVAIIDSHYAETPDDLPDKAKNIIKNSGLQNEYLDIIPLKETEITFDTKLMYHNTAKNGSFDIKVNIKNNSNITKDYKLKIGNYNDDYYNVSPVHPIVTIEAEKMNEVTFTVSKTSSPARNQYWISLTVTDESSKEKFVFLRITAMK